MCAGVYQDVLSRLKEERENRELSQEEISRYMKMSQSLYSKAELGNRRFTYHEVRYLIDSDIDLHYVFTGIRAKSECETFLPNHSYVRLLGYLNMVVAAVLYCYGEKRVTERKKLYARVRYVNYAMQAVCRNENILLAARKDLDYTQQEIAEQLHVDIKTLRALENGRSLPNSEILWKIYHSFQIPPAVFIEDPKGIRSEIGYMLGLMDEEVRSAMFGMLESTADE